MRRVHICKRLKSRSSAVYFVWRATCAPAVGGRLGTYKWNAAASMSINLVLRGGRFAVSRDGRRQKYLCLERCGICISEYECRKRHVRDQAARPSIESLIQPEEPVSVSQRRKLPGYNFLEGWSDVGSRDVVFC